MSHSPSTWLAPLYVTLVNLKSTGVDHFRRFLTSYPWTFTGKYFESWLCSVARSELVFKFHVQNQLLR